MRIHFNDDTTYEVLQIYQEGQHNEYLHIEVADTPYADVIQTFSDTNKLSSITLKDSNNIKVFSDYTILKNFSTDEYLDIGNISHTRVTLTFFQANLTDRIDNLKQEIASFKHNTDKIKEVTNKLDENIKSIQDQLDESIDTEKMDLEEYRTYKKQLIGKECREKIHSGIDFEINGTIEHFTYNADDQINFIDVKVMCDSGFPVIPYHESSGNTNTNPCKFYPAEDMGKVYMQQVLNKFRHTTKCNAIYQWLDSLNSKSAMSDIFFESALPPLFQTQYDKLVEKTELMMQEKQNQEIINNSTEVTQ